MWLEGQISVTADDCAFAAVSDPRIARRYSRTTIAYLNGWFTDYRVMEYRWYVDSW